MEGYTCRPMGIIINKYYRLIFYLSYHLSLYSIYVAYVCMGFNLGNLNFVSSSFRLQASTSSGKGKGKTQNYLI